MGKMCLAMIVANERPVIERCLDSMVNLIDRIYISINADEDGTQECIENWGKTHNIETTVWYDPWDGYGPNKTRNLAKIRKEVDTEYIIFIDADEVFITDPANPTSYPTKKDAERLIKELDSQPQNDVWYMKSYYGHITYERWQIIRNNQEWIWQLPYQEFLEGQTSNNRISLNWIYNLARHEGHSSRHEDRRPNVERLEKWLFENPNTPYYSRVCYYLGEGFLGVDDKKAVEYLKKRLTLDGWNQENYMAAYKLSQFFGNKNSKEYNPELKTAYLIKCTDIDPIRLEAYHHLIKDAYDEKDFKKVLDWIIISPINHKEPQGRFSLENSLYDGYFDFWLSVYLYYCTSSENSNQVNKEILNLGLYYLHNCIDKVSLPNKQNCINNLELYNQKLKGELPQSPNISVLIDHVRQGVNKNVMIAYFTTRAEPICGFQERYASAIRLAMIYDYEQNVWKKQEWLIKATQIDPFRIEPFYELAKEEYSAGNIDKSIGWTMLAKTREIYIDRLEVDTELYKWKFDFWISIIAIKTKDPILLRIGYQALERCKKELPSGKQSVFENNLELYRAKLFAVGDVISNTVDDSS